jgi:hypothetical protein
MMARNEGQVQPKRVRMVTAEGREVVGPRYLACMHMTAKDAVEEGLHGKQRVERSGPRCYHEINRVCTSREGTKQVSNLEGKVNPTSKSGLKQLGEGT